jgi:hypothetical protein
MNRKQDGCPCSPKRTPGFPVEFPGVDELHAAFLNESRTRTRWWRLVQEIRVHGPKTKGRSPHQSSSPKLEATINKNLLGFPLLNALKEGQP